MNNWKLIGLITLSIRFVQGWIFWGGGSRRFIYDPSKLDPHAPAWMANKLQSAMPGALLGVSSAINFLLQHFVFLYIAIIAFSLVELLAGAALLAGFCTRLAGFITALISIFLMLTFGWQGSTCLDEWTMAISNLAMGLTLALAGASIYSIDSLLLTRHPQLEQRHWFVTIASGAISWARLKTVSTTFLIFTIIFALATYNYYRGSIISHYHAGPVSVAEHHFNLSDGKLHTDGSVSFSLYVDGGSPAIPSHIMRIELQNAQREIIESWEGKNLNNLANDKIQNLYLYNRITTNQYGIVAPVSAKATITLNPINKDIKLSAGNYSLIIYTINGQRWNLEIKMA